MNIQVTTDNHIQGSQELTEFVEGIAEDKLERFQQRITRIQVHLSDQNGPKRSGEQDKRCKVEARLNGLQPLTVSDEGANINQAVLGAMSKMEIALDRALGKLDDRQRRNLPIDDMPVE